MVFNLGSTSTRKILFPTFMISRLDICPSQNIQIVDWFYVHDLCYILLPGSKTGSIVTSEALFFIYLLKPPALKLGLRPHDLIPYGPLSAAKCRALDR